MAWVKQLALSLGWTNNLQIKGVFDPIVFDEVVFDTFEVWTAEDQAANTWVKESELG